ncbi:MAG: fructosamine kinase family protein [Lachnospiraceae bacterium]|nr:fructosamine kinase family protein [Lachnospiraceae bacterium]
MEILTTSSLDEAIAALFGESLRIVSKRPVYGGDINESYRLSLSDGTAVFMKCNTLANLSFFEAEAKGLEALRQTGTIGVPKALGLGTDKAQRMSFLLMEYLDANPRVNGYWEIFGRELAALHRADCHSFTTAGNHLPAESARPFGFEADNYIGASPQINTPKENWLTFFQECRLLPQFRMAEKHFDSQMRKQCTKLLEHLDSYLVEPEFPSLLHGDLWSGNAVCGPDGKAWILDPAVYVGHFEAELAMTELFGANPVSFYEAYHEINRIDSGYQDRKDLYNLYHMLNHLNLFGGSYKGSVQRILNRYVGRV